jgi:hypothetical protein
VRQTTKWMNSYMCACVYFLAVYRIPTPVLKLGYCRCIADNFKNASLLLALNDSNFYTHTHTRARAHTHTHTNTHIKL